MEFICKENILENATHHSGDKIYATNANRKYTSSQHIQTNFAVKGKEKAEYVEQSKHMRSILNKNRSTVLEGSFGNEKKSLHAQ